MTESATLKLLSRLKARLDALEPDGFFGLTEDLRPTDFALIGQLIQAYCFADLNARRVIDSFRMEAGEDPNASRMNDKDVLLHLTRAAQGLADSDLRRGLLTAAKTLELHREHRHHFAHYAVLRHKRHDVFIILTMNAREAQRRGTDGLSVGEVQFGLVPIPELTAEVRNLDGLTYYLAKVAAQLTAPSYRQAHLRGRAP